MSKLFKAYQENTRKNFFLKLEDEDEEECKLVAVDGDGKHLEILLAFQKDGRIRLYKDIDESLGIPLDTNGSLIISK